MSPATQLALLVTSTTEYAVVMLSPSGTVTTWNAGAERLHGYRAADIVGKHCSVLHTAEDVAAGRPAGELEAAAHDGRHHEQGWQARRDGSTFWAEVTVTALRDPDGTLVAFGRVTRDLTAQQEAAQELTRLQSDQQRILDTLAEGVILYDVSAAGPHIAHANRAACEIFGLDVGALRSISYGLLPQRPLVDGDGQPLARMDLPFAVTARTGQPVDGFVWGWPHADGTVRWLSSNSRPVRDAGGRTTGVVFSASDITRVHDAARALTQAHARYSALVEHSADVVAILDVEGRVQYLSPSYEAVFDEPPAQRLGRRLRERIHAEDRGKLELLLEQVMTFPEQVLSLECRVASDRDEVRFVELTAANRLDDPAIGGIVATSRDVTERVVSAARLAHEAMHDSLTGLPNRALLLDRLGQSLARAARLRTRCALLFVDLDHFKVVNDSSGHRAGDQVLRTVALRLSRALRPGDTVARLGGDEFVILAEQIPDRATAKDLAERVRSSLTEPIDLDDIPVRVGCSIGIAISDGTATAGELLQQADTALYRAKARGRGRWELYDRDMRVDAQRRIETEAMLRQALTSGRVVVHYQPIVTVPARTEVGREALVRLDPADSGELMLPSDFIQVAEDTGLIVPLGLEVLDQACQACAARLHRDASQHVAVNLSARQLLAPNLVRNIDAVLHGSRIPPRQLCLELTESALTEAADHSARQVVQQLADLGIAMALDDFGTGMSSLAHLRAFPISVLKIDRSFTAGLGVRREDTEVVKAIVGLGEALGLTVVAEGVETQQQHDMLATLGCPQAQGLLYGPPAPAD